MKLIDDVIVVEGLTKRFGEFVAVNNLNMNIKSGSIHGFLGPNGSGKTTAIRMMCGLMDASQGRINVLGLSMPEHASQVRDQVGYMTQKFALYEDLTIKENLHFIAKVRGIPAALAKDRLNAVMIDNDLAEYQSQLAGSLSGGQKRRLAFSAAVLTEPRLLILDEPTSEVDPNTRREMWAKFFKLASVGTSILVSTHLMDEAERCHYLTVLNDGVKVADGKTDQLKNNFSHQVVLVEGENVTPLTDSIMQMKQVLAVAQSGLVLRVIVSKTEADPVRIVSENIGPKYSVRKIKATIEDVFVAATQTPKYRLDKE